jgi:hypothetical protein
MQHKTFSNNMLWQLSQMQKPQLAAQWTQQLSPIYPLQNRYLQYSYNPGMQGLGLWNASIITEAS